MIPVFRPVVTDGLRRAILDAIDSRWWGYGPRCNALEGYFTDVWGGHALATSSCTSALYLAALALRPRGREVIVPALTFVSTAIAFHHAGLRVRIADVDPSTLMLTVNTVEPLLTNDTAAVVAVHLYGQHCPTTELAELCAFRGIALVEDRAHRIGIENQPNGDFVTLSFNAVKELPVGEGGLLWCRARSDGEHARHASYLGMGVDTWQRSRTAAHRDYEFSPQTGLKLRMTDLTAALALAVISELPARAAARHALHERYRAATHQSLLQLLSREPDDSLLMSIARVPTLERERLRAQLAREGISTSVHYPSLAEHQLFSAYCPVAAKASAEVITLPSATDLTPDEIEAVVDALARVGRGCLA